MASRARAIIAVIMVTMLPHLAEAAWKIQQFQVFAGAPYQRANGAVEAVGFDWAEMEDLFPGFNRQEVESAFNAAAVWYSSRGFPEPLLEPVVDTDNGPAYRIYVCSEQWAASGEMHKFAEQLKSLLGATRDIANWASCENWGAYNGRCAMTQGARPVFFLNADGPAFRNGNLTAQGYQTVAHEIFHAIQANTVMGKSPNPCKLGKWITEGMADAVSMDVLDDLWKGVSQPKGDGWVSKKFGVRPYEETFARDKGGYPVSSWWRFLADLNGGYDYLLTGRDGLPGVFDFEVRKAGDWRSEVMWLDEGLLTKFNMRLNELLGLFMNDYAMRVPPLSWTSGNPDKDVPKWVKGVLGECEEIMLSDRKPSHRFSRNIAPLAGDCAWLTVNIAQATTQVSLQAESNDLDLFKDIWVGLAEGGTTLSDAMMAANSPTGSGKSLGIWFNYTVRSHAPTLLTFTNAADDPEASKRRVVLFDISMPSATNSLRGNAPAGPGKAAPPAQKPSYKKHTQTLQKKTAATTAMVAAQKRLDMESLSPNASQSTSISMRPEERQCREPFKYQACGPYTSFSLELVPGTYANIVQVSGSGGNAGQILSTMMGQAMSTPLDGGSAMTDLAEKLEAIDAASVSITMPFIDYGFTGTINNAMISTSVGGIAMQSVGPLDSSYQAPLNGSVSIEEFTPMGIRGSYSAPLAHFEAAPGPNEPPIHVRGPTLTGTFNQVAPWLSDRRVQPIELQTHEEIANEVGKSLGVSPEMMRAMRDGGKIPGGGGAGTSSGGGSSASVSSGECDCDCANQGKVDELCEFFCEAEFEACP